MQALYRQMADLELQLLYDTKFMQDKILEILSEAENILYIVLHC